jgi:hypothetical protein
MHMVPLYHVLNGENAIESFIGSILSFQSRIKKRLMIVTELYSKGSVPGENKS